MSIGQLITNKNTMQYRRLGKTELNVSVLSFGCMRLTNDQELNTRLISRAINLGINYFEGCRYYLQGTCWHRTAPGLQGKTRGIIVSGKDALTPDKTPYTFLKEIERQLDILNLTHFKFYQVGGFTWKMMPHLLKRGGVFELIRKAQNDGLIQHIGFTSHDTPENCIKCLETGIFESIMVPYNLIDRSYEPTITRAGELGIGVVVMNPIAGGVLSIECEKLKHVLNGDIPTAELALRFVLANKNVSTVCSGMNMMEHLEENVCIVKNFNPDHDLKADEILKGVNDLLNGIGKKVCTGCRYCLPCKQGVDIPRYLSVYYNWKNIILDHSAHELLASVPVDRHIFDCIECRQCEKKCPNQLPIVDTIRKIKSQKIFSGINA
jgi:predicted aldo/keto reductase-like oxidoreductase